MTTMVFMLLCGNFIDNTESHKYVAVAADMLLAIFYTTKGIMLAITPYMDKNRLFFLNLNNIDLILTGLHPIINLLILMQLFNWVSKKYIALLYGFIYALNAGLNILKHNSIENEPKSWSLYIAASGVMVSFAILDHYKYKFYPIEAGIFIDSQGRNKNDL